ncbi:hypothetical protein F5884DRAFT_788818 [Xylogone sp. PMI_703]|nr:hypothetical protein F5884DRAFT_788818 [Xylogone sp. PMI_703]
MDRYNDDGSILRTVDRTHLAAAHRTAAAIERRRKKRETDRMAQRASRERTKRKITLLEETVAQLKAAIGSNGVLPTVEEIVKLKEENAQLKADLERVTSKAGVTDSRQTPRAREEQADMNEYASPNDAFSDVDFSDTIIVSGNASLEKHEYGSNEIQSATNTSSSGSLTARPNWSRYQSPDPLLDLIDFDPACIFWTRPSPQTSNLYPDSPIILSDREKWHLSNDVYIRALESYKKWSHNYEPSFSHKPYAAIMEGWDILDEDERSHPVWEGLRWVDERVFGSWQSKAQRVAIMLIKQRLMTYLSNPTKANLERVPSFLRPRPSQEHIAHPLIIEFLIWPGLRERLVFHHQRYSDGAFSRAYSLYLRFHWPFPDSYILVNYPDCNCYRISELFERYACDVRNWAMAEEFFEDMAEMRLDIPSVQSFK